MKKIKLDLEKSPDEMLEDIMDVLDIEYHLGLVKSQEVIDLGRGAMIAAILKWAEGDKTEVKRAIKFFKPYYCQN